MEKKNGIQATKYDHKKWTNQTQFGNSIGVLNVASITQYYSTERKRNMKEI